MRSFPSQILSVAVCLVACAGCATHKTSLPPAHRVVGTIVLVNEANRFVLIDGGMHTLATAGTALKSFSGDQETGVLALSPERKPPFIIADIVKGSPKKGDQVIE